MEEKNSIEAKMFNNFITALKLNDKEVNQRNGMFLQVNILLEKQHVGFLGKDFRINSDGSGLIELVFDTRDMAGNETIQMTNINCSDMIGFNIIPTRIPYGGNLSGPATIQ